MNTIEYIENNLTEISKLGTLDKFDFLLSSANAINTQDTKNQDTIISLIIQMKSLRFEFAYNRGIESISARLDKVLAYEILKLSRIVFKGKDLAKSINDVLYYESNEGFKSELLSELQTL